MDLDQIKSVFDALSHICLGLMVVATAIVQLTPTKADDRKLDAFFKRLHKYMSFMPTVGQNPMTKEALKKQESQEQKEPMVGD